MNKQCFQCHSELRLIPAGISKAGKPYQSFLACPNRCKLPYNGASGQNRVNTPSQQKPSPDARFERLIARLSDITVELESISAFQEQIMSAIEGLRKNDH